MLTFEIIHQMKEKGQFVLDYADNHNPFLPRIFLAYNNESSFFEIYYYSHHPFELISVKDLSCFNEIVIGIINHQKIISLSSECDMASRKLIMSFPVRGAMISKNQFSIFVKVTIRLIIWATLYGFVSIYM